MRARRLLILLAAVVAALPAVAASAARAAPPEPRLLDEGWAYAPDPEDRGVAEGWQRGHGGGWEEVEVPHVFEGEPREDTFGGTVGWYRLTFEAPEAAPGGGWAVRFGSVRREATVWLDGREIGHHRDPYNAFTVPLGRPAAGEEHTLVVRVDNRKGAEPREGWWNWGGIVRPVTLVPQGRVVLEDAAVLPDVSCPEGGGECRARVLVDGWVRNDTDVPQRPEVALSLERPDEGGRAAARAVRAPEVAPGERRRVRFAVDVEGPLDLWSPERPALYDATLTTRLGDRAEQVDEHRVGLREVEVRDGLLRLNGRALELRGASIQEDMPGRGPALTDADIETIVGNLERMRANVTRAHYLLDRRLLEAFDEAGILVWSQAPVYHRDELLRSEERRAFELGVLRDTVLGARGHASVLTHSVANELYSWPDARPSTGAWLRRAAEVTRDLDPTVPVSLDILSYPGIDRQETYEAFDVLGINSYYGWYKGKPDRSVERLADLGPYLREMHEKYPRHAMVITEFGAEATFAGPRDVKETYAFQTDYVRRTLEIVRELPFMGGAIYWTLREFAVKPDWDGGAERDVPRDSIHNKALITYDGRPKPAWDVTVDLFAEAPLYRGGRPRAQVLVGPVDGGPAAWQGLGIASGVFVLILALLALDLWCVRDILRARRRRLGPAAQVIPLRRAA